MTAPASSAAAPLKWSGPASIDTVCSSGGCDTNPLLGVSCPATNVCAAGGGSGLFFSANAGGGADAWQRVSSPDTGEGATTPVYDVSCPSTTLCVGVALGGKIFTSTDPAGGSAAWTATQTQVPSSDGALPLISCAAPSLCAIVEEGSRSVSTTTDPNAGASAWRTTRLPRVTKSVSCVRPHFCLIGTETGDMLSSKRPTGGPRAWHVAHVFGRPGGRTDITAVACASPRFCFAGTIGPGFGALIRSTHPTGGVAAWGFNGLRLAAVDFHNVFTSGSCVRPRFCAFADTRGSVYFPSGATGGRRGPPHTRVDSRPANEHISCATSSFCALAGSDGDLFIGR